MGNVQSWQTLTAHVSSVTKVSCSCFYPARKAPLPLVADAAEEHPDSEEEMDEYDEYDAADRAWTSERTEYFSPRIAAMILKRSQGCGEVERDIKFSKTHWSTVVPSTAEEEEENRKVFQDLCNDSQWMHPNPCRGHFFEDYGSSFKLGRKIAEGGQAEIFEGDYGGEHDVVLKVFKKGYLLSQLQRQWPAGVLRREVFNLCYDSIMLEDGRFAFVMAKAWGDLRKLIDLAMQENNMRGPPFAVEFNEKTRTAEYIMWSIAHQMKGILHRDLKASNILLRKESNDRVLADFECSIGVEGTGFWRAPELLLALKNKVRPIMFTEKMDVYSFAMTCYEIVSGRLPFEGELRPIPSSNDIVIGREGVRPKLPSDLDGEVRDLIVKCWDWDPNVRRRFLETRDMLISIISR